MQHERLLRRYRITQLELAFDVKACSIEDARARFLALIALLDKSWHQRGHLWSVQNRVRPAGRLSAGNPDNLLRETDQQCRDEKLRAAQSSPAARNRATVACGWSER